MNKKKHWDIFFKDHKCPCIILSLDELKILYLNKNFSDLFGTKEDSIGKSVKGMFSPKDVHMENILPNWHEQGYFETSIFNKKLNTKFLIRASILKSDNAIFCELLPLNHDADIEKKFDNAMLRCMEIHLQPATTIIPSLLELIGDFYDCERAYIYRVNFADNSIHSVALWANSKENESSMDSISSASYQTLLELIERDSKAGLLMIDSNDKNNDLLKIFNLDNIILHSIEDKNNKILGIVGLSNRKNFAGFFERRLINIVSSLVSQVVISGQIDTSLLQLHYHDILTGLYNRLGYSLRIEQIMQSKPTSMGVISVNVNGLRYINENAGIAKGDEHIKKSAKLLKEHFNFEFFRMAGDEFLGIAPNVSEDEFEDLAMSLYTLMRNENNFDFSLGHTWRCENLDILELIEEADILMYINKQQYYSTNSDKHKFDSANDTTLHDLLAYLADDEFMVYLQPQIVLKDGSLYGAEALIRRYDKKAKRMIYPDQFISFYEQKSVIRHIDIFVLETVCKLQENLISLGTKIPISVNFSRVTLQEYGIVDSITRICDSYNVPHELVVIEITERVGINNDDNVTSDLIKAFKNNGFNISLDDFGCAYSNIVILAQIDVDEVKIDKSLVDFIIDNKKNHVLVKNILSMCDELDGASTLAEGIEDKEQESVLLELGCHLGQGYFYSVPLPINEFLKKYIEK